MSELSKCFYEVTAGKTCRDLCHPEYASCWISFFESARRLLPGSFKLYLTYLLIPPLVKGGGYTRQFWRDHFASYIGVSYKTYLIAVVGLTLQCLFYKMFGQLHYYWVMGFPGFFSAALSPKLSRVHLRLQGITYFNMMLEVMLKKSKIWLVVALRESKLCGTLLFMIFNAQIMDLLQQGKVNQFWFMHPLPVKQPDRESTDDSRVLGTLYPSGYKACSHEKSCDAFIADGILKYTAAGFIIEIAGALITKFPLLYKDPARLLARMRNSLSLKLMSSLAVYIGSYRLIGCLLCRHYGKDSPTHNRIASFLCGISYMIYPKFQVFTLAFSKFVELSWEHLFKTAKNLPDWALKLDRIPYLRIVHMVAIGYMYHSLVFYSHLSPPFNSKAVNYCSDNRVERLKRRLLGWMLDHEWSKA
ncbi:uncharacterized protein LOC131678698 [Topomyia yanbarensis]|uniref:uncharacterized protein LOC131678698 n=1 Tax=Topomyia yanbarensis TaxID=2498891 RepID=UPI00273CEB24|nr:uncharacterized protein LOC131678698 [Topomyia yanbarensis]